MGKDPNKPAAPTTTTAAPKVSVPKPAPLKPVMITKGGWNKSGAKTK